jgi:hypothetical protein
MMDKHEHPRKSPGSEPDAGDHARLDAAFELARAAPPEPSADLLARILADARATRPISPRVEPRLRTRGGLFAQLWRGLGGWPAAASLSGAVLAGIWIGASPPASVLELTASLGLSEEAIMLPDGAGLIDLYLGEG